MNVIISLRKADGTESLDIPATYAEFFITRAPMCTHAEGTVEFFSVDAQDHIAIHSEDGVWLWAGEEYDFLTVYAAD